MAKLTGKTTVIKKTNKASQEIILMYGCLNISLQDTFSDYGT